VKREEIQEVVDKASEDGEKLKRFLENVKVTVEGNPGLTVEEIDELIAEAEEFGVEEEA